MAKSFAIIFSSGRNINFIHTRPNHTAAIDFAVQMASEHAILPAGSEEGFRKSVRETLMVHGICATNNDNEVLVQEVATTGDEEESHPDVDTKAPPNCPVCNGEREWVEQLSDGLYLLRPLCGSTIAVEPPPSAKPNSNCLLQLERHPFIRNYTIVGRNASGTLIARGDNCDCPSYTIDLSIEEFGVDNLTIAEKRAVGCL